MSRESIIWQMENLTPEDWRQSHWRVVDMCAEDHSCAICGIEIVRETIFAKRYGDGSIGEIELRYRHPTGFKSWDGSWLIRPGQICGALYGIYEDGSFQCWAD